MVSENTYSNCITRERFGVELWIRFLLSTFFVIDNVSNIHNCIGLFLLLSTVAFIMLNIDKQWILLNCSYEFFIVYVSVVVAQNFHIFYEYFSFYRE